MLDELSEDLKKILLAGIGAAATTVEASKELVEKLIAYKKAPLVRLRFF